MIQHQYIWCNGFIVKGSKGWITGEKKGPYHISVKPIKNIFY